MINDAVGFANNSINSWLNSYGTANIRVNKDLYLIDGKPSLKSKLEHQRDWLAPDKLGGYPQTSFLYVWPYDSFGNDINYEKLMKGYHYKEAMSGQITYTTSFTYKDDGTLVKFVLDLDADKIKKKSPDN